MGDDTEDVSEADDIPEVRILEVVIVVHWTGRNPSEHRAKGGEFGGEELFRMAHHGACASLEGISSRSAGSSVVTVTCALWHRSRATSDDRVLTSWGRTVQVYGLDSAEVARGLLKSLSSDFVDQLNKEPRPAPRPSGAGK